MGTTNLSGTPAFLGTSSVSYSAKDVRRFMTAAPIIYSAGGEGIVESGDFAVSQRAAGANQSVDVAAGEAYVKGDTSADEGSYYVRETSAVNVTLTAADATNPRIDRVVLEIKNDSEDASGLNVARIRTIDGTPTVGATLTNLTGAAAVPNTCLLLANVLVSAGDASIVTADIQDRRFGVPLPGRELFGGTASWAAGSQAIGASTVGTSLASMSIIGNGITPVIYGAQFGGIYNSTAGSYGFILSDGTNNLPASAGGSGANNLAHMFVVSPGVNVRLPGVMGARGAAFSGAKAVTCNPYVIGAATVGYDIGNMRATWGG